MEWSFIDFSATFTIPGSIKPITGINPINWFWISPYIFTFGSILEHPNSHVCSYTGLLSLPVSWSLKRKGSSTPQRNKKNFIHIEVKLLKQRKWDLWFGINSQQSRQTARWKLILFIYSFLSEYPFMEKWSPMPQESKKLSIDNPSAKGSQQNSFMG